MTVASTAVPTMERHRTANIARTGVSLLSVQGITWVSSLVGILFVPRYLGPNDFGVLATASTMVALGGLVAAFGTGNLLIKESARRPDETRQLVLNCILLRMAIWSVISVVIIWAATVFSKSADFKIILWLATFGMYFQLSMEAFLAGLQGNEKLGRISLLLSTIGISAQLLLVLALFSGGRLISVALIGCATMAISSVISAVVFLSTIKGSAKPSARAVRSTFRAGRPYVAWDLGLRVFATVNIVIMSLLVGSGPVGDFAFAYRLIGIPVFATTIITMSVYPALSAAAVYDPSWFRSVVTNAARLGFLVTAPMAAGIAVLSVPLVDLLSGGEFPNSAILVAILAFHIPAAALSTVLGMALFARDHQRRMAILAWGAAAFNIVANLIAVTTADRLWSNGAIGAAIVALCTEGMVSWFVWRWAWHLLDRRRLGSHIVRTIGASAVMAGVTFATNTALGLWAAIPAGGLCFVAASALLGTTSPGELRRLRKELSSRNGLTVSIET